MPMADRIIRRDGVTYDAGAEILAGVEVIRSDGCELVLSHAGRVIAGAVERDRDRLRVHYAGSVYDFEVGAAAAHTQGGAVAGSEIVAPMTGRVVLVACAEGDAVEKGAPLVVVEAMKMEHKLVAPSRATVARLHVKAGDQVDLGAPMVSLTFEAAP
jgi:3-methylcrotonyl-CoA carboxylase alpha subunit